MAVASRSSKISAVKTDSGQPSTGDDKQAIQAESRAPEKTRASNETQRPIETQARPGIHATDTRPIHSGSADAIKAGKPSLSENGTSSTRPDDIVQGNIAKAVNRDATAKTDKEADPRPATKTASGTAPDMAQGNANQPSSTAATSNMDNKADPKPVTQASSVKGHDILKHKSLRETPQAAASVREAASAHEGRGADADNKAHAETVKASSAQDPLHPAAGPEIKFTLKASDTAMFVSAGAGEMTSLSGPDGSSTLLTGATAAQSTAQTTPAQMASPHLAAAMRSQTAMIASPAELVDIVHNKLAGSDKPERLTVQLDPPELGRVSIDFKFDAQGLQHITVTGETPEAMKQLRQMHYHLTQALEQHGLSGQDMSFEQQFARQGQGQGQGQPFQSFSAHQSEGASEPALPPVMARQPLRTLTAGLDIKL